MKNEKSMNIVGVLLIIFLILFGLFIAYQIILKIFGGSWETESIIIALLVFNLGLSFTTTFSLVRLNSDHNHLEKKFGYLVKDFKGYLSFNKIK